MGEIKKKLLEKLDEINETAPPEKKSIIKKIRAVVKNRKIEDNLENYDNGALFLFHLTNGLDMMGKEHLKIIHRYTQDLNQLKFVNQNKPGNKGPISGSSTS